MLKAQHAALAVAAAKAFQQEMENLRAEAAQVGFRFIAGLRLKVQVLLLVPDVFSWCSGVSASRKAC